jgi:hypothetical protein
MVINLREKKVKAVENSTSALDMHFKRLNFKGQKLKIIELIQSPKFKKQQKKFSESFFILARYFLVIIALLFSINSLLYAGIKDRVVAFVDDTAITLSELDEAYSDSIKLTPEITKEEVLNSMINRILLLREAKKLRLNAPTDEEILKEYISLRLRPHIKEEDVVDFYKKHIDDFHGKDFETVREEIEHYLNEKEFNQLLKNHIDELREKAYIKIQLY